mgnify:CR=1 FL=1
MLFAGRALAVATAVEVDQQAARGGLREGFKDCREVREFVAGSELGQLKLDPKLSAIAKDKKKDDKGENKGKKKNKKDTSNKKYHFSLHHRAMCMERPAWEGNSRPQWMHQWSQAGLSLQALCTWTFCSSLEDISRPQ